MSSNTYKFEVKMTCSGCSNAVNNALKNAEGITSYNVNLEKQEVIVTTAPEETYDYDYVLAKIKKTGKQVVSGGPVTAPAL